MIITEKGMRLAWLAAFLLCAGMFCLVLDSIIGAVALLVGGIISTVLAVRAR